MRPSTRCSRDRTRATLAVLLALWACSGCSGPKPADGDADADGDGDAGRDADADGDGDAEADGDADEVVCPVEGYASCGGDLVGTWAFVDLCPDDPEAAAALCESPYDDRAECVGGGNASICDGRQTGTLAFGADGVASFDTDNSLVVTWRYTDACLEAVQTGATPAGRCASVANEHVACSYAEGLCTCVSDPMVEHDAGSADYAVTGDEVVIGDDPPATYCIDGDRLIMDYYLFHPVSWRYWVLERQ